MTRINLRRILSGASTHIIIIIKCGNSLSILSKYFIGQVGIMLLAFGINTAVCASLISEVRIFIHDDAVSIKFG